jgi:hypothetical protein
MIHIHGSSDDLISISGDISDEFTYPSHVDDTGVLLAVSDGTVLRIAYTDDGVWRITCAVAGGAMTIVSCPEDDPAIYSDVATLHGSFTDRTWIVMGTAIARS